MATRKSDRHPDDERAARKLAEVMVALVLRHKLALDDNSELGDETAEAVGHLISLIHRVRRLEDKAGVTFRGVWKEGEDYALGDLATRSGSLWHSNCNHNQARPGTGAAWTMCVKRGEAS
jgi:hypothetical protein